MLFRHTFHDGIRDGSITLTFRIWETPRVLVGKHYGFGASSRLEVDACERVVFGAIDDDEARRAGFDDVSALADELSRSGGPAVTDASRVFRIAFHYVGEIGRGASVDERPSEARVVELLARLERSDSSSRTGPWTLRILELIAANPRVAASRLAPQMGRETRAFKVDVRKLKRLGLTQSFEVGYALTAAGEAVVERLRAMS